MSVRLPDYCRACGDRTTHYSPRREVPTLYGNVQGMYACAKGHEWSCIWSAAEASREDGVQGLPAGYDWSAILSGEAVENAGRVIVCRWCGLPEEHELSKDCIVALADRYTKLLGLAVTFIAKCETLPEGSIPYEVDQFAESVRSAFTQR